jgi:uncharacterized OsmC-like protein
MPNIKKVEVEATLGERFTVESHIRGHKVFVDQPAAAGGQDAGPTPLEYLFLSLGACIASIARIVANQKRIPLRGMKVTVSGELDVNTLLGKGTDGRAGFTGFAVAVDVDADLTREEKQAFLDEVDRRCPVSDNLQRTTPVRVELA